jgi:hypothetical protein
MPELETKVCSKCKHELPNGEFSSCASHKDGLASQCKTCRALARQGKHAKELTRARVARHQKSEQGRAWRKEYDKTHSAKRDPEQVKKWKRADYKKHREEILARNAAYKVNHYEELNEKQKLRRQTQAFKERESQWRKDYTHEERLAALARYGGKCAICGETEEKFLGIDHIDGGGNIHRKSIHCRIEGWLKRNNYPDGFQVLCHNCNQAKGHQEKQSYSDNPKSQYARKYHHQIRVEVFAHYGNKCACCGETTQEFLCIDHINNDGAEHRKQIGRGKIYLWLRNNHYPDGFQILCHNCNQSKGYYGNCPHQTQRMNYARP